MNNFKIPIRPEATIKSIRFPNYVIEDVEKTIANTNCSFSAFVVEATKVALDNLKAA